jgi:hypothetical protein
MNQENSQEGRAWKDFHLFWNKTASFWVLLWEESFRCVIDPAKDAVLTFSDD